LANTKKPLASFLLPWRTNSNSYETAIHYNENATGLGAQTERLGYGERRGLPPPAAGEDFAWRQELTGHFVKTWRDS
jgi:hypothetical protein